MSEFNATGNDVKAVTQADRIGKVEHHYHQHPSDTKIPLEFPQRSKHFTDRKKELEKLLLDLQPGYTVTLCGPGGIGKSALAAEAIRTLVKDNKPPERFPDGIIWHDFYTIPGTASALEHIARSFGEETIPTPFEAAQRALSGKQVLLLLDGTEDTDNLPLIAKITGNCGVIITSRKRGDAVADLQNIESLHQDEAVKLLRAWADDQVGETAARHICELLGGLPLAVRLAGRYLRETGETADEYLKFLKKTPLDALDHGKRKLESVPLLLKRSLEQFSGSAKDIRAVAGILAFDSFSTDVIKTALPDIQIQKPLGKLASYGLLTRPEGRCMITHSLIHTYARECLKLPDSGIIRRLAEYYTDFAEKNSHTDLDQERMHIMKILEACKKQKEWKALISLVWSVDSYLDSRGYWTERLAALETGLEAARNSDDARSESSFLLSTGNSRYTLGRLNEAVQDYGRAIEIREGLRNILEPRGEWPPQMTNSLAAAYMNRGVALDSQGRYDEAVQDYGRAIEIGEGLVFQTGFAPAVPDLAMVFYNTLLLFRKEKPNEAEDTELRATAFLENLAKMTDINALPESWQKELTDLEQLVSKT